MHRIVALAGGVGGSRFARGLKAAAPDAELTVVVNTGDDVTLHGLRISPDVDTVLYALSGVVDEKRGWGPRGDTFLAMDALERLGGETWFRLGDKDLATHIRRTELLAAGWPPGQITREFAQRLGIAGVTILPMTDSPVETWVQLAEDGAGSLGHQDNALSLEGTPSPSLTEDGAKLHKRVPTGEDGRWVHFQEYFVHRRTDVPIRAVDVRGISEAAPAPGLLEALGSADVIVICPSNPFVSVNPILQVPGVRDAIAAARRRGVQVAAVSPIIGGATIKGPAARMLTELGYEPSATGVVSVYDGLLDLFLIDPVDAAQAGAIAAQGARPIIADALMKGRRGEARLARVLLSACSPSVASRRSGGPGRPPRSAGAPGRS
jgi:LPPG:FO 2-phospho-L-lactate transferase